MLPNEEVEWTTQKGLLSIPFFLGLMAMFIAVFPILFGFLGGESNGVPFPPNPAIGWIGIALILVAFGSLITFSVRAKSTKYILTNQRVLVIRFGRVFKEILLGNFMGKPVSQFLDKTIVGTVNGLPVYDIRIDNPESLDSIEFKSLNASAVERLEKVLEAHAQVLEQARQIVRCRYCARTNSVSNSVCSGCGAPLK